MSKVEVEVEELRQLRDTAREVLGLIPDLVRAKPALEKLELKAALDALDDLRKKGVDLNVLIGSIDEVLARAPQDEITKVETPHPQHPPRKA